MLMIEIETFKNIRFRHQTMKHVKMKHINAMPQNHISLFKVTVDIQIPNIIVGGRLSISQQSEQNMSEICDIFETAYI